ncbi:hypothetical protein NDU88_002212 [Pleurodeles waltl]|uniref:Uncharacterized protein n=1 Tax=Pleurodeles waltl TaxID=8319 RepID=A0AAV7TKK2_PLEWA|nr:hypothetical protein NDU88_002212 [Pleurodeles waltl]
MPRPPGTEFGDRTKSIVKAPVADAASQRCSASLVNSNLCSCLRHFILNFLGSAENQSADGLILVILLLLKEEIVSKEDMIQVLKLSAEKPEDSIRLFLEE